MSRYKRVFVVVLDSVGIGEAPDADEYGDRGANTLANTAQFVNGLHMPHMEALGLGNIHHIEGVKQVRSPKAHYGKMQEISAGKDTMTGHWELMGLPISVPFRTFPSGFDQSLIAEIEEKTGRKVIGNKVASGTDIIDELGKQHLETGSLIVYTSADSVLQIAAHEKIVPVTELYKICQIVREITKQEQYLIGRVIARPFIGMSNQFRRTANRQDYALQPFGGTVLTTLKDNQYAVIAIGKIASIFDHEGITSEIKTTSNDDGIDELLRIQDTDFTGLCFINLVDFDSLYGHRRDPTGYAHALEAFDARLPEVLAKLQDDDVLMITADHGNDPTFTGTDHTREYVPLLVYHRNILEGKTLNVRNTFADVGATISHNFNVDLPAVGTSFLTQI